MSSVQICNLFIFVNETDVLLEIKIELNINSYTIF